MTDQANLLIIGQRGIRYTRIVYWFPSLWKSFNSHSCMCTVPTFRIANYEPQVMNLITLLILWKLAYVP